jgi:hypothetical protein
MDIYKAKEICHDHGFSLMEKFIPGRIYPKYRDIDVINTSEPLKHSEPIIYDYSLRFTNHSNPHIALFTCKVFTIMEILIISQEELEEMLNFFKLNLMFCPEEESISKVDEILAIVKESMQKSFDNKPWT